MKIFKSAIFLLVALCSLVSVQPAIAQQAPNTIVEPICQRLGKVERSMLVSMETKRQQGITIDTPNQKQAVEAKLSLARSQADKIRARHFSIITNKLKDPAQKQAILNYQDSLTKAINARRTSIDEAQNTYSSKLAELISSHKLSVVQAEETMMNDVKQSFASARQDCSNNTDDQDVRSQLVANLKISKLSFAKRKELLAQGGNEYQNLTQARNRAIVQAVNQFKLSEQQAKEQLLKEISLNN